MSAASVHAQTVLDAGRPDEALRLIGAHLVQHSDDASALRVASHAQRLLGRGAESLASAEQAMRLEPTSPSSWGTLAFARQAVGDLAGAVDAARQNVQLEPYDWVAHANFSLLAGAAQPASDLTLDAAREAVRLAPNVSQAHQTLGNALLGHKKINPAIAAFTTAMRLDPQNQIARHNLAVATMRAGRPAAALADFAGLAGQAPTDHLTRSNLRVAIGNTLGQIHTAVAIASIVAVQLARLGAGDNPAGSALSTAQIALISLGVVSTAVVVLLVMRTRRILGSTFAPVVRFVVSHDRLIAAWAIVDSLALLPLLVGPFLPQHFRPVAISFGWLFVFCGVLLRVVRARIMRGETARRDART